MAEFEKFLPVKRPPKAQSLRTNIELGGAGGVRKELSAQTALLNLLAKYLPSTVTRQRAMSFPLLLPRDLPTRNTHKNDCANALAYA